MTLRDLELGDVLIVDNIPYTRKTHFTGENSEGDPYWVLYRGNEIKRFNEDIEIEYFSENVYLVILKK